MGSEYSCIYCGTVKGVKHRPLIKNDGTTAVILMACKPCWGKYAGGCNQVRNISIKVDRMYHSYDELLRSANLYEGE